MGNRVPAPFKCRCSTDTFPPACASTSHACSDNSSRARGLRSTRPSVRAASSQRHTVRAFTPPTCAPARTCAVVNAPAASSSSSRATSTGLDTLNPAVISPHAPGSPTPHPSDAQTRRRPPCHQPALEGSEVPFP
jgi:hypothetical protein